MRVLFTINLLVEKERWVILVIPILRGENFLFFSGYDFFDFTLDGEPGLPSGDNLSESYFSEKSLPGLI